MCLIKWFLIRRWQFIKCTEKWDLSDKKAMLRAYMNMQNCDLAGCRSSPTIAVDMQNILGLESRDFT